MASGIKTVSSRLSSEHRKMIAEIVKRTGETRSSLFERIIDSEHRRVMNGESVSESLAKNIETISETMKQLQPILKETAKNSKESLNAASSIYCGTLFALKELFRSIYISAGCFSNTSLLRGDQLSIIIDEADTEATKRFADSFKMLRDLKANDLFSMLLKKGE